MTDLCQGEGATARDGAMKRCHLPSKWLDKRETGPGAPEKAKYKMKPLWLLVGKWDAPGWANLQKDSKEEKVDIVIFDRDRWALLREDEPPTQYEGLTPTEPKDGMYVSESGYPIYVFDKHEVMTGRELIEALGDDAKAMFEKVGDADFALERLGLAF